jgi:1-acyl-sn-glycerol-3-phosphate acyltransferase
MIKIIGKENIPNKPVIFVSNHPCSTDVWIIPFLFRQAKIFIGRGFEIPILSQALRLMGHIDCRNHIKKRAIDSAIDYISKGKSIWIFPEGKLSPDEGLHDFYNGYIKLHNETGLDIIPITLIPHNIIKFNDRLKLAFKYTIVVGKPTNSYINIKEIIYSQYRN